VGNHEWLAGAFCMVGGNGECHGLLTDVRESIWILPSGEPEVALAHHRPLRMLLVSFWLHGLAALDRLAAFAVR
jgi:hypothetical protein